MTGPGLMVDHLDRIQGLVKLCTIAILVSDIHDVLHSFHNSVAAAVSTTIEVVYGDKFVALDFRNSPQEAPIKAGNHGATREL